jgi:hypothetical protein
VLKIRERLAVTGCLFRLGIALENPCVFRAASLRRVHNEGSLSEGDARETSRRDGDLFSVENIGTKIDVSPFKTIFARGGVA